MLRYPIYFENRICPHCGSEGMKFLDRNGKIVKNLIYPVEYMVCINCKRRFLIQWIDKCNKKIPVPCAKSSIDEFEKNIIEFVKHKDIRKEDLK